MRCRFVVIAIAIAVVSSQLTWHLAAAQVPPAAPGLPMGTARLSGDDLAFQVEGVRGNVANGRLLVRINGRWLEAGPPLYPSTRQLSQR